MARITKHKLPNGKTVYKDSEGKVLRTSKRDYIYALVFKDTEHVVGLGNKETSFSTWKSLYRRSEFDIIKIEEI